MLPTSTKIFWTCWTNSCLIETVLFLIEKAAAFPNLKSDTNYLWLCFLFSFRAENYIQCISHNCIQHQDITFRVGLENRDRNIKRLVCCWCRYTESEVSGFERRPFVGAEKREIVSVHAAHDVYRKSVEPDSRVYNNIIFSTLEFTTLHY